MELKINVEYGIADFFKTARLTIYFPKEIIGDYKQKISNGPLDDDILRKMKLTSFYTNNQQVSGIIVEINGKTWEEVDKIKDIYLDSLQLFQIPELKEIVLEI